jgi:hypothetical protein
MANRLEIFRVDEVMQTFFHYFNGWIGHLNLAAQVWVFLFYGVTFDLLLLIPLFSTLTPLWSLS